MDFSLMFLPLPPDFSPVTLDIEDIEISAGSTMAFYVASTDRIRADDQVLTVDDGVVTILGPSRYVNSDGGIFGYGHNDIAW